ILGHAAHDLAWRVDFLAVHCIMDSRSCFDARRGLVVSVPGWSSIDTGRQANEFHLLMFAVALLVTAAIYRLMGLKLAQLLPILSLEFGLAFSCLALILGGEFYLTAARGFSRTSSARVWRDDRDWLVRVRQEIQRSQAAGWPLSQS